MLNEAIKNANSIVILGHKNPDGDALGSVLAMGHFCKNEFGKNPTLSHEGVIPDNLRFLTNGWWLKKTEDIKDQIFDLAILLDTATAETQLGDDGRNVFRNARHRIKIDHHQNSLPEADENILEQIAAAAEILLKIADASGWNITPLIAKFLYAGIYTDTGGFVHDYTSADTMRAAARLMESGARPHEIARKLGERTKETFANNAETLARALFTDDNRIGYATYSVKRTGDADRPHRESGWLHAQILSVKDVDASALFKEMDDGKLYVSLRSKTKNVSKFAEKFGGGGHNLAAAFSTDGPIAAGVARIIPQLQAHLSE